MEDQHMLGSDWRNRSPENADQEYFIDKMRMLKVRLRKYEEENRLLYRCLAEQKSDVKEAVRDKCYVINNVQYEMSELKKHILVLLSVLSYEPECDTAPTLDFEQPPTRNLCSPTIPQPSLDHDKSVWISRNKTLEENFKKELKKVKELERRIICLEDNLQALDRDREDLQEKNAFIEEENNIQREQIALLEDTVRDLEEDAARKGFEVRESSTQTETQGAEMMALMKTSLQQIVSTLADLQEQNAVLQSKYNESRVELRALQLDFHERGKLMSELENELNALKLNDRCERRRRRRSMSLWDGQQQQVDRGLDGSVFLSPTSSRSCSSNSSAEFEEEESGICLSDDVAETKKADIRKFIGNLKDRRRTLHDSFRRDINEL